MRSTIMRTLSILGLLAWLAGCAGSDKPAGDAKDPTPPTLIPADDPAQTHAKPVPMKPDVDLPDLDGAEFAAVGEHEFETAKKDVATGDDGSQGASGDNAFGNSQSAATGALAPSGNSLGGRAPAPAQGVPAVTPNDTGKSAAPDVMREIVEADIVQAEGDTLYVLNRYRGLLLVDMSDPDAPFIKGRVPFQAQPVDMYLRDGRAYVVVSDYFDYWQFDADADPFGFHGSQVLVVDVSNTAAPAVTGSFDVDGEVTDTRIVGDVLYAVSKRNPDYWRYDTYDWEDTTWVMSIDIADPTHIAQVDRAEFAGSANIVQVYENALSIAAIDPNYYLVDDANLQQTLVTYVDISDPKGKISVGDGAYVPGSIADKFKMDLFEGHLRVISSNALWQPDSGDVLTVFDATDPKKLTQSAQIDLDGSGNPQYVAPQATRYAGADLFVNLCWYLPNSGTQQCRVDLYDVGNPATPAKVSALPVDGPITHFEVRGDRLLALGYHTDQSGGTYQNRVQVALYDVADLTKAARLSAIDLGDQNSSSAAQQDYKAFKVLQDLNMILLPLSWSEYNGSQYRYHMGAQIIDWQNDQLVERGKLEQRGEVQRAIAFKDRVVSISTEEIQVIDAANRSAPVATADLFLVRSIVDVFDIQDHQVQLGYDEDDSSFRFFVLPFGADDLAQSVAELPVDLSASYQMQAGNVIHVVGFVPSSGEQQIRSADFSDPEHPRWRGTYSVGTDIDHIWSGGGGGYYGYSGYYDYYWDPSAGQPLNNELLAVTTRVVNTDDQGRRFFKNYLKLVDLRDPDNLHLANGSVELPDWGFINRVKHGNTLYSIHTEPALDADGKPKAYHERYFVDRVDASNPDAISLLPKVNVPGQLVDVDDSGTIWYTVDYQWDEHGRRRNSLNVLKVDGDQAVLTAVLPVGDEIDRARYLDREIWLSTHSYPWWGLRDDSPDSRQPYTRLTRLRIDDAGAIAGNDAHDVAGYHFDLLDVEGATVYLASTYPTGLVVLDTSDIAKPTIVSTARTIGYVSKIVHKGDYLYMPMGPYGVRRTAAK